jgi:hypothetical protein
MPTIAINPFVHRQTAESRFTHYEHGWDQIVELVRKNFENQEPGYRDGVVLVSVPPEGFWSSVVTLSDGDRLEGAYEPRTAGEEPRKETHVVGKSKSPAAAVDIVLYRHDVLVETNEHSGDAEWEVISINGRPTLDEMPMSPGTLMANHFQISGGTATHMNDAEFVAALKKSFLYWRDKSLCSGK